MALLPERGPDYHGFSGGHHGGPLRPPDPRRHAGRRHRGRRARPGDLGDPRRADRRARPGRGAGAPDPRRARRGRGARASSTSTPTTTRRSSGTACSSISPWHGVTTVVIGNCGFGIAPTRPAHRDLILRTLENVEGMSLDALRAGLGERLAVRDLPASTSTRSSARGTAINVGALVGHTPVRLYVMGEEATEREATRRRDRARCARIVARGARAPARSASRPRSRRRTSATRASPVPSRAASLAEIEALAGALGDVRPRRHAGDDRPRASSSTSSRDDRARRPASRSAGPRCSRGMLGPGRPPRRPRAHGEAAGARASRVVPQVSCRPLMLEFQFKAPFPFESMSVFQPVSAADLAGQEAHLRRPRVPRRVPRRASTRARSRARCDDMVISRVRARPRRSTSAASPTSRRSAASHPSTSRSTSRSRPISRRASASPSLNTDEDDVAELLAHPATDARPLRRRRAREPALRRVRADAPARPLGAREGRAHARGGRAPADVASPPRSSASRDRGRLAVGLAADVTVFDPDDRRLLARCAACATSRPAPTASSPTRSGIRAVIVERHRRSARTAATPSTRRRRCPAACCAEEAAHELPDHLGRLAHHRAAEHLRRLHRRRSGATGRRAWSTATSVGDVFVDRRHEEADADGPRRRGGQAGRGDPRARACASRSCTAAAGTPRRASPTRTATASPPRSSTRPSAWCSATTGLRLQEGLLRRLQPLDRRVLRARTRTRLLGCGQTAMRTPEEGIARPRGDQARSGLRGVMMPGNPAVEDYDSPVYDEFWRGGDRARAAALVPHPDDARRRRRRAARR